MKMSRALRGQSLTATPAAGLTAIRSGGPLGPAGFRVLPPEQLSDGVLEHIFEASQALDSLRRQSAVLARWGQTLAHRLASGGRLLAAGNGGSAAEAQHLTAELVGRYDGERRPFSAIALHGDTSAMTAIGNDYGYDEVFARQVRAHARPGDVVILLSTSGKSPNLVAAAQASHEVGALSWALTGPGPNPLSAAVDEAVALEGRNCHVQEAQLIAIHALCECFDACVAEEED
ncbi:D-sedoheptulose-7-phosphate isomerase [Sinomonas susongensis]|uniref:D-sedoheptulose-7-phosphate isomerase n=1 Tax=Sinomonas susongensis TaxID=1324851 RepID=UPI001FEACDE1|nr:SIS domain-containing protein [Sinomonas susongensis]